MNRDAGRGHDTIAAQATPPGHGGIGVIRVSGPAAGTIAAALAPPLAEPRRAALRAFRAADGEPIDRGLLLWLPAPGSYTGEDSLELQGHGGPAVVDALLARVLELGARAARPGEFTERAFLNGRLDLAQAEAVADLIESADRAGARAAMRSLEGAFSQRVEDLSGQLTGLRAWIEATLDFPEEEVDYLADPALAARVEALQTAIAETRAAAAEGRRLVEGQTVVIAGAPNAGKSTLLNRLAGAEAAIVTEVPGTTRDTLRESIRIEGVPLTVIDTAGLRDTDDPVESEGVRRARAATERADRILLIVDSTAADAALPEFAPGIPVDVVRNKIDLSGEAAGPEPDAAGRSVFRVSAATGAGLEALRAHLHRALGAAGHEGVFSARRRHLDALDRAAAEVAAAVTEFRHSAAGELVAEHLRRAQDELGAITGRVTSEDLLGEIFGRFCIGK
ncbi:MAG: tRNA uridine-5-carboxymethylaminomethyl(34) synthesis GTPase MnmE [Halofilum sp. (in: g-proteobacteria)]|nr:tRNA uridine-5-carboxymethylaminomethyl(34) synthesis GTPase MnmE [Halofilum sp. (in: g-proteobacteria)]